MAPKHVFSLSQTMKQRKNAYYVWTCTSSCACAQFHHPERWIHFRCDGRTSMYNMLCLKIGRHKRKSKFVRVKKKKFLYKKTYLTAKSLRIEHRSGNTILTSKFVYKKKKMAFIEKQQQTLQTGKKICYYEIMGCTAREYNNKNKWK